MVRKEVNFRIPWVVWMKMPFKKRSSLSMFWISRIGIRILVFPKKVVLLKALLNIICFL